MKLILLIFNVFLLLNSGMAQTLKGTVYETDEEQNKIPLVGTNVFWEGTQIGTTTDEDGFFELRKIETAHLHLIVSYIGFEPDTIEIPSDRDSIEIVLSVNRELEEVVVTSTSLSKYIATQQP